MPINITRYTTIIPHEIKNIFGTLYRPAHMFLIRLMEKISYDASPSSNGPAFSRSASAMMEIATKTVRRIDFIGPPPFPLLHPDVKFMESAEKGWLFVSC